METIAQFIKRCQITMDQKPVATNPHMDSADMFNYEVCLRMGDRSFKTHFSKGRGLPEAPILEEVLGIFAEEAAGFENSSSFEDWCGEFGYDTDSRKAERTWLAVVDESKRLKTFLGESYEKLLWETERE